mmetsp:Transcript_41964/g.100824  ORF Transcript_41964/g.100824 Transcript_41964/m.100824 type:complete len:1535 (+) Transcript_41964:126-4730(+)
MTSIEADQDEKLKHAAALADAMASDSDDDDEDYVPDSLKEMFADADKQLEYFLDSATHAADPVPDGHNHFFNDDDDDDDESEGVNSSMIKELGAVAVAATAATTSTITAVQQDQEEKGQLQPTKNQTTPVREDNNEEDIVHGGENGDNDVYNDSMDAASSGYLDIMHPSAAAAAGRTPEITDSEVKDHMRGAEIVHIDEDESDVTINSSSPPKRTEPIYPTESGDGIIINNPTPPPTSSSSLLMQQAPPSTDSIKFTGLSSTSRSPLKLGRKLQTELDREAQRASLPSSSSSIASSSSKATITTRKPSILAGTSVGPSSSLSLGIRRRRNNQVAPIHTAKRNTTSPSSSTSVRLQQDVSDRMAFKIGSSAPPSRTAAHVKGKGKGKSEATSSKPSSWKQRTSSSSSPKPKPFKARPAPTPPKPVEVHIPTPGENNTARDDTTTSESKSQVPTVNTGDIPPLGGVKSDGHNAGGEDLASSSRNENDEDINFQPQPVANETVQDSSILSHFEEDESPSGRRPLTKPDENLGRLTQPTSSTINSTKDVRSERESPTKLQKKKNADLCTSGATKGLRFSNVSSRLLKPTASVMARKKHDNENSPPNAPAVKETLKTSGSSALEASRNKARLRARMEARKRQETAAMERKPAAVKTKEADERRKESQERLKRLEEERVAKLKEKIHAKQTRDNPAAQRATGAGYKADLNGKKETIRDRNQRLSNRRTKIHERPAPTIPKTPKFATDRRMHQTEPPPNKKRDTDRLSLANSSNILMKGLRAPLPKKLQASSYEGTKPLTIPTTPKLETIKRHPVTKLPHSSPGKKIFSDDVSWSGSLRDNVLSPISKAGSAGGGSLTIPEGPKFQPIRKRPLPKSTAEREQEEMEYYKAHPFRAHPPSIPKPPKSMPPPRKARTTRPLTTPEPFRFSLDGRAKFTHAGKEKTSGHFSRRTTNNDPRLRARTTAHTLSTNRRTPATDAVSSLPRRLTTPEPFHFHTDSRGADYTPQIAEQSRPGAAESVPSGSAGVPFRRRAVQSPDEAIKYKPFRARPVPKYLIPKSVQGKEEEGRPSKISEPGRNSDENDRKQKFHARKMPNFDRITIPVNQQLRSPLRKVVKDEYEEEEPVQFRAKPVPEAVMSPPKIPVRQRDPSKLRSPDSVKRPEIPQPKEKPGPTFHARPVPASITKEPTISVVKRDPGKLRSPEKVKIPPKSPAKRSSPSSFRVSPPKIPVRERDPTKLRSPNSSKKTSKDNMAGASKGSSVRIQSKGLPPKPADSSSKGELKLHKPVIDATQSQVLADASMEGLMGVSPVRTPSVSREQNRKRIQDRIASRKKKGPSPVKTKSTLASSSMMKSPPAFTSSKVKDRLNRGKEQLAEKVQNQRKEDDSSMRKKSQDESRLSSDSAAAVDVSIESMVDDVLGTTLDLPLRSSKKETNTITTSSDEGVFGARVGIDDSGSEGYADAITPKVRNATDVDRERPAVEGGTMAMDDNDLRRQVELACAAVQPEEDESESVLQLAQEVQRLAEDELSFHGSVPSRSPDSA